jgi:hypothetical protein
MTSHKLFDAHLQRIRSAKEQMTGSPSHTELAEQSVTLLLERFFDLLCVHDPDWQEMKPVGDLLRKLIQSYVQLKVLKDKEQIPSSDTLDLSEQTLADIEDQLQLL